MSIVLPVYNGEKYLSEQIKSITEQTYGNIEIIIIDDNSQDVSLSIAHAAVNADSRINVYKNQKNLGIVANFLKGVSLAQGEFVCFCDQDDYWMPDKVAALKELLESNPKNMLAYSDLEICDEKLECIYPSFWGASSIKPKNGYLKELSFLKNITPGCSMMFKKNVKDDLVKIPYDAPFMHDHLALIISSGLGKVIYTDKALVKYRQHRNNNIGAFYDSLINKERIIKELREKVAYFKKLSFSDLNLNLEKLLSFCNCLRAGNISMRLSFINYYLFLRNDTFLDKTLGIFECFSPTLYGRLKKIGKKEEVYVWIKRLFFLTWSIVVLFYFAKCFILYKFTKFLTWIK